MQKTILLIFAVLIALPAICQVDTTGIARGQVYFIGAPIEKRGYPLLALLKIKLRKATVHTVRMGMDAVYLPESDVVAGNVVKTFSKIITYQLPVSTQVSQVQLDSISNYIKKITESLITPQPPKADLITNIDDAVSEKRNVYTPTAWIHISSTNWLAGFFNKTASYFHIPGSTIETTFDGYKIEWYTELQNNHGIAAVSIDGGIEVMVDLYADTRVNNSQKVWTSPILPDGTHKIKIRVTGNKNPKAIDSNIIHDLLISYKKQ